eukprot:5578699-Amphidinium_carterae.2
MSVEVFVMPAEFLDIFVEPPVYLHVFRGARLPLHDPPHRPAPAWHPVCVQRFQPATMSLCTESFTFNDLSSSR